MIPDRPAGLGPYFSRLGEALEVLDAEGLRDRIRDYARRLEAPERRALLAVLESTAAPPPKPAPDPDEEAERLAEDALLQEIDDFVERLEEGHYYQGWGWDPELRDERAWGDESWAEEMDYLFGEAEEAYLSGDLPWPPRPTERSSRRSCWTRTGRPSAGPCLPRRW